MKTFVSGYNSLFLVILLGELAFMVVFFVYYLQISSLKTFIRSLRDPEVEGRPHQRRPFGRRTTCSASSTWTGSRR